MKKLTSRFSIALILILLTGTSCSNQTTATPSLIIFTTTSTLQPIAQPTITIQPTPTRQAETEMPIPPPEPTPVFTSTPVIHPMDLQISFFAMIDEQIPVPGLNNYYKNNTILYLSNLDGSNRIEVLDEAYSDTASYVWSPDGQQVAYVTLDDYFSTQDSGDQLYSVYDLKLQTTLKLPSVRSPAWHTSGKALVVAASEGWLTPTSLLLMDIQSGAVLAELPYQQISPLLTYENFCMAPDGETLAILTGGGLSQTAVHLIKAVVEWDPATRQLTGKFEPLQILPFKIPEIPDAFIRFCTWSPDGSKLAFSTSWGDGRVSNYVYTFSTASLVKLTLNVWDYQWLPVWSPDGQSLAHLESRDGPSYVVIVQADGTGRIKIQPDSYNHSNRTFAWTPDGSHLIVSEGVGLFGAGAKGLGLYRRDGTRVTSLPLPEGEAFKDFMFRPGSGFAGPWPEETIKP